MESYTTNIEDETKDNEAFRRVLFTGPKMQLVVMSLKPGEDIGSEVHPTTDQFFRVEKGVARVELESGGVDLEEDSVIIVPAGTRHNVINASSEKDLKLYTIYAPPEHPDGTLQATKQEAVEAHMGLGAVMA